MPTYDFATQLARGIEHERVLDQFFATTFHIAEATPAQQRQGIDRIFVDRGAPSMRFAVEYKADSTAARTHRAFVETVSVDTANKPGWVYTCQADRLVYYIPPEGLAYVLRPVCLRAQLPRWLSRYPQRAVANDGYHTHGVLVPLDELERIAEEVVWP